MDTIKINSKLLKITFPFKFLDGNKRLTFIFLYRNKEILLLYIKIINIYN